MIPTQSDKLYQSFFRADQSLRNQSGLTERVWVVSRAMNWAPSQADGGLYMTKTSQRLRRTNRPITRSLCEERDLIQLQSQTWQLPVCDVTDHNTSDVVRRKSVVSSCISVTFPTIRIIIIIMNRVRQRTGTKRRRRTRKSLSMWST